MNGKSVPWAKVVVGHLQPFFGQMQAKSVGSAALAGYVTQRRCAGIANSTLNRELSLLRRAFNLGYQQEPRSVHSVPRIPRLAEKNVRKGFFEHSQFTSLRAELPEHLRPVITFAYSTGCRKGEILGIRWTQVDFSAKVVRLEPGETKNEEARMVPMIGEVFDMLTAQREMQDQLYPKCPYVFSRFGKRILNFYAAWSEASKRAGLIDGDGKAKRLFHDLRRTGVRNLIRAGVPERVAMMISGHKTRSVLDRYNIVDERDISLAGQRLDAYHRKQSSKHNSSTSEAFGPGEPASAGQSQTNHKLLN
jgi:integrase